MIKARITAFLEVAVSKRNRHMERSEDVSLKQVGYNNRSRDMNIATTCKGHKRTEQVRTDHWDNSTDQRGSAKTRHRLLLLDMVLYGWLNARNCQTFQRIQRLANMRFSPRLGHQARSKHSENCNPFKGKPKFSSTLVVESAVTT